METGGPSGGAEQRPATSVASGTAPRKIRTFRLDIIDDYTLQETLELVELFFEKTCTKKYVIAYEISEKTKKPHLQGCWECKCSADEVRNQKRIFKKWKSTQHALTPAHNPDSYCKYIKKDGDIRLFKGWSKEDIDGWGEWEVQTEAQRKETRRQKFYNGFIDELKAHPKVSTKKYDIIWIASRLLDYVGKQPSPEMVPWLKSVVFGAQCKLIYGEQSLERSVAKRKLLTWLVDGFIPSAYLSDESEQMQKHIVSIPEFAFVDDDD